MITSLKNVEPSLKASLSSVTSITNFDYYGLELDSISDDAGRVALASVRLQGSRLEAEYMVAIAIRGNTVAEAKEKMANLAQAILEAFHPNTGSSKCLSSLGGYLMVDKVELLDIEINPQDTVYGEVGVGGVLGGLAFDIKVVI